MAGISRQYFTCANSSQGFINYFPSNLEGMQKIYILKGGPGTGKSTLMKKIGGFFQNLGQDIEEIRCSSDSDSLDGVILCGSHAAIVDGTAPHVLEPQAPGAVEEYVNLGTAWNSKALAKQKDEILALKKQISQYYQSIYEYLGEAKSIHDQQEALFLPDLDINQRNQIAKTLSEEILSDCAPEKTPRTVHRFLGALTPKGSVNTIENLTQSCKKRYFIKGGPGSGKSTLMKKIAADTQSAGLSLELYHCSLDPESLDMVILPTKGICIFDSTPPHELFPSRDSDFLLDLEEIDGKFKANSEKQKELHFLEEEYLRRIEKARGILEKIHCIHDDLERIYIDTIDFKIINQITENLIQEIQNL